MRVVRVGLVGLVLVGLVLCVLLAVECGEARPLTCKAPHYALPDTLDLAASVVPDTLVGVGPHLVTVSQPGDADAGADAGAGPACSLVVVSFTGYGTNITTRLELPFHVDSVAVPIPAAPLGPSHGLVSAPLPAESLVLVSLPPDPTLTPPSLLAQIALSDPPLNISAWVSSGPFVPSDPGAAPLIWMTGSSLPQPSVYIAVLDPAAGSVSSPLACPPHPLIDQVAAGNLVASVSISSSIALLAAANGSLAVVLAPPDKNLCSVATEYLALPAQSSIAALAAGSLGSDSSVGVAAAVPLDDSVVWFAGCATCPGRLNPSAFVVDTSRTRIDSVLILDIDGDGSNNLVAASSGDGFIVWFPSIAADVEPIPIHTDPQPTGVHPRSIRVAPVTPLGDSAPSLATNRPPLLLLNTGKSLAPGSTFVLPGDVVLGSVRGSVVLAAGDITNDALLDAVVLSSADDTVQVVPNNQGNLAFNAPVVVTTSVTDARGLALGDWSGDGIVDILCTSTRRGTLTLFVNTQLISASPRVIAQLNSPTAVVVGPWVPPPPSLAVPQVLSALVASPQDGSLVWVPSWGDNEAHVVATDLPGVTYLSAAAAGFVVSADTASSVAWLPNTTPSQAAVLELGNGVPLLVDPQLGTLTTTSIVTLDDFAVVALQNASAGTAEISRVVSVRIADPAAGALTLVRPSAGLDDITLSVAESSLGHSVWHGTPPSGPVVLVASGATGSIVAVSLDGGAQVVLVPDGQAPGAASVLVHDWNGDGSSDLLVAAQGSSSILLFASQQSVWTAPVYEPRTLAVDTDQCGKTLSCMAATLARTSLCATDTVLLHQSINDDDDPYVGCFSMAVLTLGHSVIVAGGGSSNAAQSTVECGSMGGAFLAVASTADINVTVSNVAVSRATSAQVSIVGGAAMVVSGTGATLTLSNVAMRECMAQSRSDLVPQVFAGMGGAIQVSSGGSLWMGHASLLESNTAAGSGGGLAVLDAESHAVLEDVDIVDNHAVSGSGGGVFVGAGGAATLSQVRLLDNTAALAGGAVAAFLVPIGTDVVDVSLKPGVSSSVSVVDSQLHRNVALWGGAAAVADSPALPQAAAAVRLPFAQTGTPATTGWATVSVLGGSIADNKAAYGGVAFSCSRSNVSLAGGTLMNGNTASVAGGVGFSCLDTNGNAGVPPLGVHADRTVTSTSNTAVLYGPDSASPASVWSWANAEPCVLGPPRYVPSGQSLGPGASVTLADAYGSVVLDPSMVVVLAVAGSSSTGGGSLRAAATESPVSFADVTVAKSGDVVGPLMVNMTVTLDVVSPLDIPGVNNGASAATTALLPTLATLVEVTDCPAGFYDAGQSDGPVLCAPIPCSEYEERSSVQPPPLCGVSPDDVRLRSCRCRVRAWRRGPSAMCVLCPTGASCPGGDMWPVSAPGYAATLDPSVFAECPGGADACLGGCNATDRAAWGPDACCATGYGGSECSACTARHFLSASGECNACPSSQAVFGAAIGVFLAVVVGLAVLVLSREGVDLSRMRRQRRMRCRFPRGGFWNYWREFAMTLLNLAILVAMMVMSLTRAWQVFVTAAVLVVLTVYFWIRRFVEEHGGDVGNIDGGNEDADTGSWLVPGMGRSQSMRIKALNRATGAVVANTSDMRSYASPLVSQLIVFVQTVATMTSKVASGTSAPAVKGFSDFLKSADIHVAGLECLGSDTLTLGYPAMWVLSVVLPLVFVACVWIGYGIRAGVLSMTESLDLKGAPSPFTSTQNREQASEDGASVGPRTISEPFVSVAETGDVIVSAAVQDTRVVEAAYARARRRLVRKAANVSAWIVYFFVFTIMYKSLEVFRCIDNPDPVVGGMVLSAAPSVRCWTRSGAHPWLVSGSLVVLLALLSTVLATARHVRRAVRRMAELGLPLSASPSPVAFLFTSARDEVWWYEAVVFGQRTVLAFVLSLIPPDSVWLTLTLALTLLGFGVSHWLCRPATAHVHNAMNVVGTLGALGALHILIAVSGTGSIPSLNTLSTLFVLWSGAIVALFVGLILLPLVHAMVSLLVPNLPATSAPQTEPLLAP